MLFIREFIFCLFGILFIFCPEMISKWLKGSLKLNLLQNEISCLENDVIFGFWQNRKTKLRCCVSLLHPWQLLPWQLFGKLKDVAMGTWFVFQALEFLGDVCTGKAELGSESTCCLNSVYQAIQIFDWGLDFFRPTITKFAAIFIELV